MQTVGLYGVVRGAAAGALRPGRLLEAAVRTSDTVSGVLIPRDALARLDAATWVYVRTGADTFERRAVNDPQINENGWLVTQGFSVEDQIVTRGLGYVLAAERGNVEAGE
jgi:hypothetical protein